MQRVAACTLSNMDFLHRVSATHHVDSGGQAERFLVRSLSHGTSVYGAYRPCGSAECKAVAVQCNAALITSLRVLYSGLQVLHDVCEVLPNISIPVVVSRSGLHV